MIAPSQPNPPNTDNLVKILQIALVSAMPVTIAAMGGPHAIWSNGGYTVRILLSGAMIPSAICGAGALENLARAIAIAANEHISGVTWEDLCENELLGKEITRAKGMARAALFPVSGWAVVAQLPVNDYYIYAIPIEILKDGTSKSINGVIHVAINVNSALNAIGFWKGMEIVCKVTVKPTWRAICWTSDIAYSMISWSLGLARDMVVWGMNGGSR